MAEYLASSDLAAECDCTEEKNGVSVSESEVGGCGILRVQIKTPAAAERMQKPMGHYVTVKCGPIDRLEEDATERAERALGVELRSMAERLCGRRITRELFTLTPSSEIATAPAFFISPICASCSPFSPLVIAPIGCTLQDPTSFARFLI